MCSLSDHTSDTLWQVRKRKRRWKTIIGIAANDGDAAAILPIAEPAVGEDTFIERAVGGGGRFAEGHCGRSA
jgi:hypothetical protein